MLHNERKNGSVEVKKGLKADEQGKAASGQGLPALVSLKPALHHLGHLDLPGVHICYWCKMKTYLQQQRPAEATAQGSSSLPLFHAGGPLDPSDRTLQQEEDAASSSSSRLIDYLRLEGEV